MELIGHKTVALLDLWSLFHFFIGVAIGNIPLRVSGDSAIGDGERGPSYEIELSTLMLILALAYAWELLEYGLEAGGAGQHIAYWFQGREHWINRLLSDPLLVLIGYLFSRRFQLLIWPARLILIVWLWQFILIRPHSMAYL